MEVPTNRQSSSGQRSRATHGSHRQDDKRTESKGGEERRSNGSTNAAHRSSGSHGGQSQGGGQRQRRSPQGGQVGGLVQALEGMAAEIQDAMGKLEAIISQLTSGQPGAGGPQGGAQGVAGQLQGVMDRFQNQGGEQIEEVPAAVVEQLRTLVSQLESTEMGGAQAQGQESGGEQPQGQDKSSESKRA